MIDDATSPAPAAAPQARQAGQAGQSRQGRRGFWTVLVPVVTAGAGIMFAMSFQTAQGSDLRGDRDLPQQIVAGDSRVATLTERLDSVQKDVIALSSASSPYDSRLRELNARAQALAGPAATTKVSGPAIEVALNDSDRPLDSLPGNFTGDDVVVHQQDVQAVVNALWRAGAEAMMIQDQRVISTSAVRCVGNTLILQGRVYAPPFVIKAIGNTGRMQQSLDADPSVSIYRQYVDTVGLGYDVTTPGTLEFPAFAGAVDAQQATPIR